MPIKCCQGQAKITQSLEITVCASAQISLRRLCFSSICVDLISAAGEGDGAGDGEGQEMERERERQKSVQTARQMDIICILDGHWLQDGRVAVPNLCVVVPNLRIYCVVLFRTIGLVAELPARICARVRVRVCVCVRMRICVYV